MHNWLRVVRDIVVNRRGGVPRRPGWCTYLVTYRCNACCGMCDSWRIKPGTELTPEQVGTVFRKIGRLDVVRLTGGEPFVRDDFLEIARAIEKASRPAVLHITSNGSLPDLMVQFVEQFPAPRKLRFMISLDGMPEEHDASRGREVTFAVAEESIQRLAVLRKRGISLSINHTVISARSLEDHDQIVARFAPLGVDVQAVLAYSDSAMYGLKRQRSKAEDLILDVGYPLHPKLRDADCVGFVERSLARLKAVRDPILRLGKKYYLRRPAGPAARRKPAAPASAVRRSAQPFAHSARRERAGLPVQHRAGGQSADSGIRRSLASAGHRRCPPLGRWLPRLLGRMRSDAQRPLYGGSASTSARRPLEFGLAVATRPRLPKLFITLWKGGASQFAVAQPA